MSEAIHKSHNVSKLMYQFVLPTKYRRVVISDEVEKIIKETCIEISKRYELIFLEIGADKDHVHFLVQSAPNYSPAQIVKIVKSITARAVFLWGNLRFTGQVREVNVYEAAGIPGYVSASSPPHSGTPG